VGVIIRHGDCREVLRTLPEQSVHCCVTSPPYFGLRDYGNAGQIGLEATPDAFVAEMVAVFREVKRVLRDDGTLWLNLGDSYAATTKGSSGVGKNATNKGTLLADRSWQVPPGLKAKDLIGIPWRVAFALQADGWYLRQDIIWSKPNPMPESVTDRCTKAHEYIFLMSKSARYYYDADAIEEPASGKSGGAPQKCGAAAIAAGTGTQAGLSSGWAGSETRNKRSVWEVTTQPFSEAHFATFPPDLIEPCIKAGCPKGGTVIDPFGGAGTTGLVADRLGRDAILIELNPEYAAMAQRRIEGDAGMFAEVGTVSLTQAERKVD
jgi:DNA modification methylase